jgi:hypothetical protein
VNRGDLLVRGNLANRKHAGKWHGVDSHAGESEERLGVVVTRLEPIRSFTYEPHRRSDQERLVLVTGHQVRWSFDARRRTSIDCGGEVHDGFRFVRMSIHPPIVMVSAGEHVPGEVDAAQRVEAEATAGARLGHRPQDDGSIHGVGNGRDQRRIGKRGLQHDDGGEVSIVELGRSAARRLGVEQQVGSALYAGDGGREHGEGGLRRGLGKRHVERRTRQCHEADAHDHSAR